MRKYPLTEFGIRAKHKMMLMGIEQKDLAKMVNDKIGTAIDSSYLTYIFAGKKSVNENARVHKTIVEILELANEEN